MGYRNWGNELFSYVNKSASTLHYDSKSDWVLLVEGETDCIFYSQFTEIAVFQIDVPKDSNDEDLKNPDDLCKVQILHLVYTKLSNPNQKHWYGIIDKDYDILDLNSFITSSLKERKPITREIYQNVNMTTAHSLETMLIQLMGVEEFETFIHNTFSLPNNNIQFNIIKNALDFAFKIGCLRKWKTSKEKTENTTIKLDFETVANDNNYYYDFLEYDKKNDEIKFFFEFKDKDSYTNKLFEKSKNLKKDNIKQDNYHGKGTEFENDKWVICHGHDTFNFIKSIINKCYGNLLHKYNYKYGNFEKEILMNYPANYFEQSSLGKWLDQKDDEYEKNKAQSPQKKIIVVKKKTK